MDTRGLSEILSSGALSRLALYLLLFPDRAPRFRELQRWLELGSRSLQRELARMEAAGLLQIERQGRSVRVRARSDTPAWKALWALAHALASPHEVLRVAMGGLPGLQAAYIHGSFACGEQRPDSDVDLLLLGREIDADEVARRTLEASAILGREVNPSAHTPESVAEALSCRRGYLHRVWIGAKDHILGTLPDDIRDAA